MLTKHIASGQDVFVTFLVIMAAPGAMSERQLQKLLTEGKFPEASQKEDVKSSSGKSKGRGKGTTSIPLLPEGGDTTSSIPEPSESKGKTKPISGGRGKTKTDAKEKRKMDDNDDVDDDDDDLSTTTSPTPIIGREIVIDCFSTINYLLRLIDEIWTYSPWNKKLLHFIHTNLLVIV